ncbi:DNA topoisomerase (ATP-hydrolyzing) subunit B [Patescibacteria group bacterium]|nr:DNA topoisomerase (ATP-hydrolyzing) subunit B [Patescibacteria group bacterium]
MTKKTSYNAESIQVLEGLEPVRKRPGMYIGNTASTGLHHLIWEVVDNSIDEAIAGYCDTIEVILMKDGWVSISDNGRGIPVEKHIKTGKSALETVLTVLHAGGKFERGDGYKVAGGLHGVGVSVVNALSTTLIAEIKRDGKIYKQEFSLGKSKGEIKAIGKTDETGTSIIFKPDPNIFTVTDFSTEKILTHIRQQTYLTKKVKMAIIDRREEDEERYNFYFEGGIKSYIKHLNKSKPAVQNNVFYFEKEQDDINVEISLQYTNDYNENVLAFANNIYNPEGGTHISGFRTSLTRTLNAYAKAKNYLKDKDPNFTGDDVKEGLTAVVSVKIPEPQFEGQTKAKLGNVEVKSVVENLFKEAFNYFLEENPKDAEAIIKKCSISAQARHAARAARENILRKSAFDGITLPGKLADCSSKSVEETEIFIVEGDSAGGSAKQGRDRRFQAILPLWGKMLNTQRSRIDRVLKSDKMTPLVVALGTNIGENFDLKKLRYGKIIIMTDADVDGAHIATLLLTFFYKYFRPLVEQGHIFLAVPPLYSIRKGKKLKYFYNEEELQAHLKNRKVDEKFDIQRYKGLGEMNPTQLWDTTMNPESRRIKRIEIDDFEKADEVFEMLMGQEVAPRRRFIETHARSVENLDV